MRDKLLLIIVGFLFSCNHSQEIKPLMIAHRGIPSILPEESILGYQAALEYDIDYLEADIQRTKDSVLVCFHDENLQRTTNVEEIFPSRKHAGISAFTFEELQKLDAGTYLNKRFKNTRILKLKDLITLVKTQKKEIGLYLETKKASLFPGIELDIFNLLKAHDMIGYYPSGKAKIILQTFDKNSLPLLHKYFPNQPLCWLIYLEPSSLKSLDEKVVEKHLKYGLKNGASIIGPSIAGPPNNYPNLMSTELINLYKSFGYQIHAYTFMDIETMRLYKNKVDGYFTDIVHLSSASKKQAP